MRSSSSTTSSPCSSRSSFTLGDDYTVFTASNGKQGLEILEREEIALVIVDEVMPRDARRRVPGARVAIRPQAIRMLITG